MPWSPTRKPGSSGAPRSTEPGRPTVGQALDLATARLRATGVPEPRADAAVLLAWVLGVPRARLAVLRDDPLPPEIQARFGAAVARREAREPAAYITGEREFFSLPFYVDRRVLIPRPETECLVEAVLQRLQGGPPAVGSPGPTGEAAGGGWLVDAGTGSGAVAVTLASRLPWLRVLAVDLSAGALAVARRNVERHGVGGRVRLVQADALEAVGAPADGEPSVTAVVSNPPYVARAEWAGLPPEVRDHEPRLALDGGGDGLVVVRRVAAGAARVLPPGGWLALEVGAGQAPAVADILREGGFGKVEVLPDLAGIPRVVVARRSGPA